MGGWKSRRRIPRRKFDPNRYLYDERSSRRYDDAADNVPLWEKEFCMVIGSMPWGKVVFSKALLDYHDNILHWDDSAGEEAFRNAKRRFWDTINGFYCDLPLPDPDLHIDRVNWNQVIDPELVKDLDREYFHPDEMKDGVSGSGELVDDGPWERGGKPHKRSLKVQDWRSNGRKDDCNDVGCGDPWELSNRRCEWGDGAKLSSWSHWEDQPNHTGNALPRDRRFWNDEGWGYPGRSSPSQNYQKRRLLDRDRGAPRQIHYERGLQDRRLQGGAGKLHDRDQWDSIGIIPNIDRSLPPQNGDYRKHGSSYSHIPRYKRTRFHGGR